MLRAVGRGANWAWHQQQHGSNQLRLPVSEKSTVDELLTRADRPLALVWVDRDSLSFEAPVGVPGQHVVLRFSFVVSRTVRHCSFPFRNFSQTPTTGHLGDADLRRVASRRTVDPADVDVGLGDAAGPSGRTNSDAGSDLVNDDKRPSLLASDAAIVARLTVPSRSWPALVAAIDALLPRMEFLLADLENCGGFLPTETLATTRLLALLEEWRSVATFTHGGFLITTKARARGDVLSTIWVWGMSS